MCRDVNLHTRKSQLDLKHKEIADKMTKFGKNTSPDSVQTYFSGGAGVPIDKISAVLYGLDLQVVDKNVSVMPSDDEGMYLNAAGKFFELKRKLKILESTFREKGLDINELLDSIP